MRLKLGAVICAVALAAGMGSAAVAKVKDSGTGTAPCLASDGTTVVGTFEWTPTSMWPPNHKLRDVTVNYTDLDNDGDAITFSVDSVTSSDEGFETGSAANHSPDVSGTPITPIAGTDTEAVPDLTTTFQLRAERMGHNKEGRTYTIVVSCTDAGDASLTPPTTGDAILTVHIAHDRGHHH